MITTIGVDADDTIWHNENKFQEIYDLHHQIMQKHVPLRPDMAAQLLKIERKNLNHYGYGAKGLILSVIESVLEVTKNRVSGEDISRIISVYHRHLAEPVQFIDGVRETLECLKSSYRLILITKGDYIEQYAKITTTKIDAVFSGTHIVPEKDAEVYRNILQIEGIEPENFLMVGNSLRSDILPVLDIGGSAVHIPYHLTWEHETLNDGQAGKEHAPVLSKFSQLPEYLGL